MIIHTIEYISNIMHMRIHAHIRMRIHVRIHTCAYKNMRKIRKVNTSAKLVNT